jgi:hypothetical protein
MVQKWEILELRLNFWEVPFWDLVGKIYFLTLGSSVFFFRAIYRQIVTKEQGVRNDLSFFYFSKTPLALHMFARSAPSKKVSSPVFAIQKR